MAAPQDNSVNGIFSVVELYITSLIITSDIEWDELIFYTRSDHWPIILKLFSDSS